MARKITLYVILYLVTAVIIFAAFEIHPNNRNTAPIIHWIIMIFISLLILKYSKAILLIIIAPWNRVLTALREKRCPSTDYKPKVSVIIPAYNEEVGLLGTIKSVLKSDYKNLEVIIVNDGSTDSSHKIMLNFLKKYKNATLPKNKPKLKYFYKKNEGKGKALNYGIQKSAGEIIITIDADCAITPTTIKNFVKPFADKTVSAVVGNVKIGNKDTVVGLVQFLEFLNSFYAKNAESVLGTIYIIGGAAAAFRRKVFKHVGLYNHTNITEDIDISVRIRDAGLKVVYAEKAIVYTEGAINVNGLAKQRLRWKIGWFQTLYTHSHILFSTHPNHNKILSWIMIPLVYISNIQLIFEPWFIIFLYLYSYWLMNFTPFLTWIGAETIMITVVIFAEKKIHNWKLLLFAPITWLLFYLSTYIEHRSLLMTMWYTIKKKEVKWQKWQRRGCGISIE